MDIWGHILRKNYPSMVLLMTPFCVLVAHFVHKKNTGMPYIAYLLRTWYIFISGVPPYFLIKHRHIFPRSFTVREHAGG